MEHALKSRTIGRQDIAVRTIAAHRTDLVTFARWFPGTLGERFSDLVVCLSTSSGFKDSETSRTTIPVAPSAWEAGRDILKILKTRDGLR